MSYNINIMADIFNKVAKLYDGDQTKASEWMTAPNEEFNGYSPLSYCKPYEGAVAVEKYVDKKLQQKNNP